MSETFKSKTLWREKLEKLQQPKVVKVPPKMQARFGKGKMLIPTPLLVDELMNKTRKGKLITVGAMRRRLARDFKTDVTCPLTTGIFVRIAAEAAEEDRAKGRKRITPYWRVVKDDGSLYPKFPGGIELQARKLRSEGMKIHGEGRQLKVKEFEKCLMRLD